MGRAGLAELTLTSNLKHDLSARNPYLIRIPKKNVSCVLLGKSPLDG